MTWMMAGAAALSVGTSVLGATSQRNSAIRNMNSVSKAEGEAIVKERLNATIQNSYSTAFAQMQLGLKKKQLSQQGAELSAAALAAKGDVTTMQGATHSIGASTEAVISDIDMKAQAAIDQTSDAFENAVENYNNDLQTMVLNTAQSAPTIRRSEYNGPGTGEILGMSLLAGVTSFASSYAMRSMSLGLGPRANVPSVAGTGLRLGGGLGLR